MDKQELAELALRKIKMRFDVKINTDEYYLSYSGGNDSHVLWWVIKNYCKLNIKTVAVNTYREHREIRKRMYDHADIILYPTKKMKEINEEYGMPCFTKFQDEIISRYQRGSRARYTLDIVNGVGSGSCKFKLNNKARTTLLSGELHKVSQKCCEFTKKKPLKDFEKQTGLKPIIAVRASESVNRTARYQSCLNAKGQFTPMYDITDEMIDAIIEIHNIEVPEIYNHLKRTGCIGCPYGKNVELELSLVTEGQRKYAIESFKESYQLKGISC